VPVFTHRFTVVALSVTFFAKKPISDVTEEYRMSAPFKLLFDFLRGFEPEVSGRGAMPVPPEWREKMRKFAAGTLDDKEQEKLREALEANPAWVTILALEVKALRQESDNDDAR
jgi:hypothetical protein